MSKFLSKVIEVLDGTPAEYGKQPRGQSVVELALVTPLLIVLFASMVEIGWFANNYLTLLDATRSGARIATGLQDTRSPLEWDDRASLVPNSFLTSPGDEIYRNPNETSTVRDFETNHRGGGDCNLRSEVGFYDEVACRTIGSLDPLPLRNTDAPDRAAVDDVIVSAFAVQIMKGTYLGGTAHPIADPPDASQAVVVGRYPANANECEINGDGTLKPQADLDRDPFDLNSNGKWDVKPADISSIPSIADYQTVNSQFEEVKGFDPYDVNNPERQVGFSWFGNHRIKNSAGVLTGCIGSRWTIEDVQRLVNLPSYLDAGSSEEQKEERRALMPNQGIAMVELYWEHKPLLNLPFFQPIYGLFSERATIEVWAAFPLPAVEPFIQFSDS